MSISFQPHDYAVHLERSGKYATDGGDLFYWNDLYWEIRSFNDAAKAAYGWLVKHRPEFASSANAATAVRAALLHCAVVPKMGNELVIPCQNGYLRLRDAELVLSEPSQEAGLRYALRCLYEPGRRPQGRFLSFLNQILPDRDVQNRVQEYIGLTLTTDTNHQRAQLWIGKGANGKGVLCNIIQALHGNPKSLDLGELQRSKFVLSQHIDSSLICADEVPSEIINEGLLKSLIAGESVSIDRKFRDPVSARITGKFLVLGNQLPRVTDHSDGFLRRWDIVPFDVSIPEEGRDPQLADYIIKHELSEVLNWALEGLLRLRKRGRFDPTIPTAMAKMLTKAKAETNSVIAWVEDADVTLGCEGELREKSAVYADYVAWCKRNGFFGMSSPRFWTILSGVLPWTATRPRTASGAQVKACNVRVLSVEPWRR
ncbi:DNA primase [Duganella sp. FT134W]|uniref:DNA primase n=1 Tax=Duganella margarita TaxID=2692170 RepID=A0A7X4KFR5_9BURK|nr:phage/plasmid primase, P4 family [Duganella margarita]MYM71620.1 DNA primase [Duganella margarita]